MNRGDLSKSNAIPKITDIQIRIRVPSQLLKSTKEIDPQKVTDELVKSCFSMFVDEMSFLKWLAADSVWNEG